MTAASTGPLLDAAASPYESPSTLPEFAAQAPDGLFARETRARAASCDNSRAALHQRLHPPLRILARPYVCSRETGMLRPVPEYPEIQRPQRRYQPKAAPLAS